MPKIADRVRETSSTTGTGDLTLAGAATGFQTFNAAFGTDELFPYCIENGTDWETGNGYLSSSTVLVRYEVQQSSNSNALVNFTGTLNVFCSAISDLIAGASIGRQISMNNRTLM